jgi:hypothetical protein
LFCDATYFSGNSSEIATYFFDIDEYPANVNYTWTFSRQLAEIPVAVTTRNGADVLVQQCFHLLFFLYAG